MMIIERKVVLEGGLDAFVHRLKLLGAKGVLLKLWECRIVWLIFLWHKLRIIMEGCASKQRVGHHLQIASHPAFMVNQVLYELTWHSLFLPPLVVKLLSALVFLSGLSRCLPQYHHAE